MPHYHFLEIGTSDFATLIQKARDPCIRGISVEPIQEYLDRLPSPPGVLKICAAVSDTSGELLLYYVPDDVRIAHGLPDWMKGTNSLGSPHPTVVRYLDRHGLPQSLIATRAVPVIEPRTLFQEHNIESLDLLKIDTEGHDTRILGRLLTAMEWGECVLPKAIRYEANGLCNRLAVENINAGLRGLGYTVRQTKTDVYATLPA